MPHRRPVPGTQVEREALGVGNSPQQRLPRSRGLPRGEEEQAAGHHRALISSDCLGVFILVKKIL